MTSPQVSIDAVPENVTATVASSEHPFKTPGKSHFTMVAHIKDHLREVCSLFL